MSQYTLTFIEEPRRRGERLTSNSIDLSPFVTDQFTGHMMGAISGRRHLASNRRVRSCGCRGLDSCLICCTRSLPQFDSELFHLQAPPGFEITRDNPMADFASNIQDIMNGPSINTPSAGRISTYKAEADIGQCTICFEPMKKGEVVMRLPCQAEVSHAFHKKCVQPWLEKNNTCPNCRSTI